MLAKLTILNHTSIPVAAKGLDAASLRARASADNLANVTTPGYQRIEVTFEEQLRQALNKEEIAGSRTNANQMYLGRPEIEHVRPVAYRPEDPEQASEVNNVDVDIESAQLAENQIAYNFDVRFIRDRLDTIQSAVKTF